MPSPVAPPVTLSESERHGLEEIIRRHSTAQQIAQRARIVLRAADGQKNTQIASALKLGIDSVRLWRQRWLTLQAIPLADLNSAERLADLPRAGSPAHINADQVCQIVAMACEPPSDAQRPISHWTNREMADEIIKRGIVESISPRHAARLLKIA